MLNIVCKTLFVIQAEKVIERLYNVFMKYEATLIEINPMAEDATGKGKLLYANGICHLDYAHCIWAS